MIKLEPKKVHQQIVNDRKEKDEQRVQSSLGVRSRLCEEGAGGTSMA
jgi:hypothetical protein